jgi:hypothetical protein
MGWHHLVLLTALAAASHAEAATPPAEKYAPGNVNIAFEGGIVGQNIGKVLVALARQDNLLPTRPYTVAAGDAPCRIALREIKLPPPCGREQIQLLDLLNPASRPSTGRLRIGQTLQIPDISLRSYRTGRSFSNVITREQLRSQTIQKSWAHLGTDVAQKSARTEQVEFDAYELVLPSSDPDRQRRVLERLAPIQSPNVRITPIPFAAAPAKAYSGISQAAYRRECEQSPPNPPKVDYRSYADTDGDLAAIVGPQPAGARAARVILIDVKLVPTPNLAGAVSGYAAPPPSAQARCAWIGSVARTQHATHLAGIIASRDNGAGFVGLSPGATVDSFDLLAPDPTTGTGLAIPPDRPARLADTILDNRSLDDPYFYLIAASLPDYEQNWLSHGQIDRRLRFDAMRPVEARIEDLRPLVVVAAGQADTPAALSPTVPVSPQNLGDLRNVVVVTACEICTREAPRLMEKANFGAEPRFVHVAAPGGSPMLGWVDAGGIGEARGTSQAAAFTAGVIAEMKGRWSDSYRDADRVKKRIQVTAWPLFRRPGHGDNDHLPATGLVDPLLALLNPRVHWLKDANGWREVRLRGFSSPTLVFRSVGVLAEIPVSSRLIDRFVKVTPPGQPPRWVLYTDVERLDGQERLGEVRRDGPLEPPADAALVPCEGAPIPLSQIEDLVIANPGFGATACGA